MLARVRSPHLAQLAVLSKLVRSRFAPPKMSTTSSSDLSSVKNHFSVNGDAEKTPAVLQGRNFEVPVPWGKVAGKEWGDPSGYPWIVLHGWLDNCGTFDTLAPIFKEGHRLICLDMPGHGFSSHVPEGFSYHYLEGLHLIRRVSSHFKLSKFALMGHSMGGGISAMFASTHPEMTSHLILLDIIKPISRHPDMMVSRTRASVDELLNFERKMRTNPAPVYSYEEAKAKLLQASILLHGKDTITEASADILLKRGLVKSECGKGFVYSRDIKHRVPSLYSYTQETICKFSAAIKGPFLIVKAKDGPYYEGKELAEEVLQVYRENPDFEYVELQGSHHVHLNEPEKVKAPIDRFLEKHKNSFTRGPSKM